MELSIFLARVIGCYLIITSLFVLINPDSTRALVKDMTGQRSVQFLVALITLLPGLLLVISHNLWVTGWPVLITLFSWLVFIAGVIRLFAAQLMIKIAKWFLNQPPAFLVCLMLIYLLFGAYLLYKSFW